MINRVWILLCLLLANDTVISQDTLDIANARLISLYLRDMNSKIERLDKNLNKHTSRFLKRAKSRENNLRVKLAKTNSLKAGEMFVNVQERYNQLADNVYTMPRSAIHTGH